MRIIGRNTGITPYIFAVCFAWISINVLFAWMENADTNESIVEMARIEARAAIAQDIVYRKWVSLHGGVYVPITKESQPNPYLDVPEKIIKTSTGKELMLMNPAYVIRQIHEIFGKEKKDTAHITSLNPIRPENFADEWETKALKAFERGNKEYSELVSVDGRQMLRLMQVFFVEKPCLKCHAKQGYKIGDVRGGISKNIPMDKWYGVAKIKNLKNAIKHLVVALLGAFLILVAGFSILKKIKEKEKTEAENIKLSKQLVQAQKMEAVGILAGGVAHDFNNILQGVMGYSSMANIKNSNPEVSAYLEEVIKASHRGIEVTKGLLAFSRKQVLDAKPADINKIVGDAEKFLRRLIGEDIEMSIALEKKDLVCIVDASQVHQVIMNLVTNARDSMPDGGKISIATESADLSDEAADSLDLKKGGHYACIKVSDTGSGIAEEHMRRIFEPFYTTKEMGKGTGLGLSIVFGIVNQHKGSIKVQSQVGKGTTFSVYLPITRQREEKEEAGAAPARGHESILLAEDDGSIRAILKLFLQEHGYNVQTAKDGQEALDLFISSSGKFDLVIMDVLMPKKRGPEVLLEMKKIRPDLKEIFISGYPAEHISDKGFLKPGIKLMAKPIRPEKLLETIREVLDS